MSDQSNEMISIEELCKILMIGKNLAYRLLTEKKIKAFKLGKKWKIPRSSLEDFIEDNIR